MSLSPEEGLSPLIYDFCSLLFRELSEVFASQIEIGIFVVFNTKEVINQTLIKYSSLVQDKT